jgi:hypothetical protein
VEPHRRLDTVSFIYTATAGGALRPAARGATSGGGAAVSIRSVRAPSLAAGRVDWLFVNRGEPEYFGAFARRGQASPRTKAVAFAHDGGVAYFIDGGPGAEFEPTNQPGGAFALKADDAVAYSRLPRSWLPIGPPRQLRLGREARGRRGGFGRAVLSWGRVTTPIQDSTPKSAARPAPQLPHPAAVDVRPNNLLSRGQEPAGRFVACSPSSPSRWSC